MEPSASDTESTRSPAGWLLWLLVAIVLVGAIVTIREMLAYATAAPTPVTETVGPYKPPRPINPDPNGIDLR